MSNNIANISETGRKRAKVFDVRPTISTAAYASGDVIGGLITLTDVVNAIGFGGFVHSITVIDESAQNAAMYFSFFSGEPLASTLTDNAAPVIDGADRDKLLGLVAVAGADYFPMGAGLSMASVRGAGLTFQVGPTDKALYAVCISAGTPTYAGTNDLIFRFGLVQG